MAATKRSAAKRKRAKRQRDLERDYPPRQLARKLRRLAEVLERGGRFRIQVAGERVLVPAGARINVAHERGEDEEEIEFQLVWPI
jgi:amphi-Trp domain-containing protein